MSTTSSDLVNRVQLSQTKIDDLLKKNLFSTPASIPTKRRRHNSSPETSKKSDSHIDPAIFDYIQSTVKTQVQESVGEFISLIQEQRAIIAEQQDRIRQLELLISQTPNDPSTATAGNPSLPPRPSDPDISRILQNQDNLEQYSRRNTLRLTGVKEQIGQGESTDSIVINIAKSIGVTIQPSDICRSHFNSKPDPAKGRELLVKFIRHNDKAKFISQRKKLRDPSNKFNSVFINEDLTKARYVLLRKLIKKKDEKVIFACWTYDGNIFFKKVASDNPIKVRDTLSFATDCL